MHLRRATSIMAALTLSAALVACGSDPGPDADPANPATIDVTVSAAAEIYSIPWLVAQQQGLFEKHGVIVENIVPGKGGSATMRTLLDGNIPIGEVSYPSIVQADAAGSELRIVGGGTQGPYPMNFYALASNPNINSIEDVRRWAYTRRPTPSPASFPLSRASTPARSSGSPPAESEKASRFSKQATSTSLSSPPSSPSSARRTSS